MNGGSHASYDTLTSINPIKIILYIQYRSPFPEVIESLLIWELTLIITIIIDVTQKALDVENALMKD